MCVFRTFVNSQVQIFVQISPVTKTHNHLTMCYSFEERRWRVITSEYPVIPSLGERLLWARKRKGWTQDQLSDASGVSRDVIAKAEIGVTAMPRQIKKLAEPLEVPPAWLVFGSEKIEEWDEETLSFAQDFHELPPDRQDTVRLLIKQLKDTKK